MALLLRTVYNGLVVGRLSIESSTCCNLASGSIIQVLGRSVNVLLWLLEIEGYDKGPHLDRRRDLHPSLSEVSLSEVGVAYQGKTKVSKAFASSNMQGTVFLTLCGGTSSQLLLEGSTVPKYRSTRDFRGSKPSSSGSFLLVQLH